MNRKGMALLMVLIALLLVTGMATAVLAAARLRQVSGSRQLAARRAFEAAAGSAARHAAEWDAAAATGLTPGSGRQLLTAVGPPSPEMHDTVVRLGASLYLIRSVALVKARDGSTLAREGVAQLVEVMPPAAGSGIGSSGGALRGSVLDNVEIVPPVRLTARGWWRWP